MEKRFLLKREVREQKKLSEDSTHLADSSKRALEQLENQYEKFIDQEYKGAKPEEIFEELKLLGIEERDEQILDIFQKFLDWNYKKGVSTSTLINYTSKLKKIFTHYHIKLDQYALKQGLKYKRQIKEELYALQMEDIEKIIHHSHSRTLPFYFALISTGCRPGEILALRKKDVDFTQERPKLSIRAETTKTGTGRSVWLTKEATHFLKIKMRKLENENDLIFTKCENSWHRVVGADKTFREVLKRAGLSQKYEGKNNRGKITLYSFRSFFFNACADVHREGYAHKMIGHGGYLPQYDRMNDEKKLEWFLDVEPSLTVNSQDRIKALKMQNKELEQVLKEKEDETNRIFELECKIAELTKYAS